MKLGPRDTVPLPFETQRHRARTGEFDLRGKAALVMWGDEDVMGAREALPPLQVDRTGVYVFPMVRDQMWMRSYRGDNLFCWTCNKPVLLSKTVSPVGV